MHHPHQFHWKQVKGANDLTQLVLILRAKLRFIISVSVSQYLYFPPEQNFELNIVLQIFEEILILVSFILVAVLCPWCWITGH